ncbi:putative bifunctional diguanylate cyclase/phosphodiesterase [Micromonospora tulbaghiae]|uniref:Diguanylate cyclase/phosphodiesterase n=2 Tax=Micromonospora tulbaghiae TaxID=479978 RepID=A0ABY0KJR6_9ACTN|nr:bifunctional diguanylate cyclase/phosphodiesterase [Micromonospora tulbaghiae]MDX5460595.1 bifunctional diguanylate cyclase/phosphodiesterase [Micromonospora tulbaghiae]SCE80893.1 diguanylate cyclase/phosphodiesterase [Micromonospora tulbaghiae]
MSLAAAAPARHPLVGRVGLVAAAVVVLGEMAWLAARLPGAALVSDLGAMAVSSWAAVLCARAARRQPTVLRRFWELLAATMALAALGRAVWTVERLGGLGLPHTPLVAGLFAAGIVTGTAALLCSRTGPRSVIGRARTLLDGVIVGLALIPIGWVVVFHRITDAELVDPMRTFGLLYPMFDLMQLTILVAVAGPGRPMWRALTVIGAGLAIRSGADAVYVSLVARGDYTPGHPVDVCWPLSYLLVGLATRYPPPNDGDGEDDLVDSPLPPWWRVALPYLPVGGAIVAVLLSRQPSGQTPQVVFVGMMGLLGVLALRQGLAANENLRLVGRLRRLAYSDQLTGLPNRLTFVRRLRRSLRAGGPVAVVLLDLDGFKQVNDRFGHAAGDRLLTATAERMRDAVGPDGMIARLGGDEFAVLVAGERQVSPEGLAVRLLAALEPKPGEEDLGVHPSASIGIAEYGPQHTSHTDLLRDADIAMYAAKAAGKAAYRTCTPELRESAVSRAELIADLRRAVDEGQLLMEFQPIVDLDTGTVRSAEALVRWRHPRLGVLTPARFLPLAEETGLIVAIDRWVIHEACRAAATWREHAPDVTVAVNIAAAHLCRPDLIATVTGAVGAAGLPPRALTLELTESALIEGSESVLDRLAQLRDLGIRIAIDDFGTGYSSLSYLHRIPATELKIDRSFVSRLDAGDARAYATVEMVNRLAGAFDLAVVAEGVETVAQHAAVTAIGCRQGQGWRYGRPAALRDLLPALSGAGAER